MTSLQTVSEPEHSKISDMDITNITNPPPHTTETHSQTKLIDGWYIHNLFQQAYQSQEVQQILDNHRHQIKLHVFDKLALLDSSSGMLSIPYGKVAIIFSSANLTPQFKHHDYHVGLQLCLPQESTSATTQKEQPVDFDSFIKAFAFVSYYYSPSPENSQSVQHVAWEQITTETAIDRLKDSIPIAANMLLTSPVSVNSENQLSSPAIHQTSNTVTFYTPQTHFVKKQEPKISESHLDSDQQWFTPMQRGSSVRKISFSPETERTVTEQLMSTPQPFASNSESIPNNQVIDQVAVVFDSKTLSTEQQQTPQDTQDAFLSPSLDVSPSSQNFSPEPESFVSIEPMSHDSLQDSLHDILTPSMTFTPSAIVQETSTTDVIHTEKLNDAVDKAQAIEDEEEKENLRNRNKKDTSAIACLLTNMISDKDQNTQIATTSIKQSPIPIAPQPGQENLESDQSSDSALSGLQCTKTTIINPTTELQNEEYSTTMDSSTNKHSYIAKSPHEEKEKVEKSSTDHVSKAINPQIQKDQSNLIDDVNKCTENIKCGTELTLESESESEAEPCEMNSEPTALVASTDNVEDDIDQSHENIKYFVTKTSNHEEIDATELKSVLPATMTQSAIDMNANTRDNIDVNTLGDIPISNESQEQNTDEAEWNDCKEDIVSSGEEVRPEISPQTITIDVTEDTETPTRDMLDTCTSYDSDSSSDPGDHTIQTNTALSNPPSGILTSSYHEFQSPVTTDPSAIISSESELLDSARSVRGECKRLDFEHQDDDVLTTKATCNETPNTTWGTIGSPVFPSCYRQDEEHNEEDAIFTECRGTTDVNSFSRFSFKATDDRIPQNLESPIENVGNKKYSRAETPREPIASVGIFDDDGNDVPSSKAESNYDNVGLRGSLEAILGSISPPRSPQSSWELSPKPETNNIENNSALLRPLSDFETRRPALTFPFWESKVEFPQEHRNENSRETVPINVTFTSRDDFIHVDGIDSHRSSDEVNSKKEFDAALDNGKPRPFDKSSNYAKLSDNLYSTPLQPKNIMIQSSRPDTFDRQPPAITPSGLRLVRRKRYSIGGNRQSNSFKPRRISRRIEEDIKPKQETKVQENIKLPSNNTAAEETQKEMVTAISTIINHIKELSHEREQRQTTEIQQLFLGVIIGAGVVVLLIFVSAIWLWYAAAESGQVRV